MRYVLIAMLVGCVHAGPTLKESIRKERPVCAASTVDHPRLRTCNPPTLAGSPGPQIVVAPPAPGRR